jgi:hypothetical protein
VQPALNQNKWHQREYQPEQAIPLTGCHDC